MAEPFERRARAGSGIFSRLPRRAGSTLIREIEELLARARRLRDVPAAKVAEAASRHDIDLSQRLGTARRNLYRRFLEQCLLDQALSDEELAELKHLRELLRLRESEVARIHGEVAGSIYGEAIDGALEDQRLDPEEEAFLMQLRAALSLPEDEAARLFEEGTQRARYRYLHKVVTRDSFLLTSQEVTLELSGTSETSLDDAIRCSLEEACRAIPDLQWAETEQIGVEVEAGRVQRWHVKLRARRKR